MAALQRSTLSYRREGSSGAVWSEKLVPELVLDQNRVDPNELRLCNSVGGPSMAMDHHHHDHRHHQSVQSSSSSSSSKGAGAVTSPSYMSRSSSLSVSALKLLNPKSFGQKFKGIVAIKSPKYGKQHNLVRA